MVTRKVENVEHTYMNTKQKMYEFYMFETHKGSSDPTHYFSFNSYFRKYSM